jgi:hypothetical protein
MLFSLSFAATVCFAAGTIIVVALLGRMRANDSIAHVLYDTEHPKKTPSTPPHRR